MSETENARPSIIRAVLEVKQKTYITPHYIRVTLTGDDVPAFADTTPGVNNKIFIPPAGVNDIHFPDFNYETGEWTHPPEHLRPTVRTYTHRGMDLDQKEMYIDFVAHGESGPASAWAINAKPGDLLGVAMKAKETVLYPKADWYLLAADATGIPVISAILETLPSTATGVVYLEVPSMQDVQELKTKADIQINWIPNTNPGENTLLSDAVRNTSLPDQGTNTRFGYVAAEFSSVKDIRQFLRKEQGWEQTELYAYSYWKFGVNEDGSVTDRHQEQKSN
ncbi:siderophore-interacting protein [Pedobacter cryoconitis]|uniref:NADPH-dependent ferric siderophore reductase n=1 Tax=Pedobacter cryoconitis TaxID=188932 RepID=A0A7X0JAI3_9SPHI|nr:siderophore-interacting protein [Pedobacter cryoconitis]MBB6502992.1 NADPH-dependent ferric siderophore reductase [Pedobacter cryoconitis]